MGKVRVDNDTPTRDDDQSDSDYVEVLPPKKRALVPALFISSEDVPPKLTKHEKDAGIDFDVLS
eukprot:9487511-Pyramimonas_sp.AAC.1